MSSLNTALTQEEYVIDAPMAICHKDPMGFRRDMDHVISGLHHSSTQAVNTLRAGAKALARHIAPEAYEALWKRRQRRVLKQLDEVSHELIRRNGMIVRGGPFEGMRYIGQTICSMLMPKLVGSYEEELHGVLEMMIAKSYDAVIDIGCAEGYYAIGLALRMPNIPIVCYDIDDEALRLCRSLGHLNCVADRLNLRGACRPEDMFEFSDKRVFVISDCEGYELELFTEQTIHALRRSDVLIEVHDFINPEIGRTLLRRFAKTHRASIISTRERDPDAYPCLSFLGDRRARALALNEFRPTRMEFFLFAPCANGATA